MTKDEIKDIVAKQYGYDIIPNSGGWTRWHALIDKYNPHTIGEVIDQAMDLYAGDQINELMLSPEIQELKHKAELYDVNHTANYFDMLTAVQLQYGYKKGELSPVALLGLFGEAGEVLNEVVLFATGPEIDRTQRLAINAGEIVDDLKKRIRSGNHPLPSLFIQAEDDGRKFDLELADVLYYLNLCALGRGKSLQYYAGLSFDKVQAKALKPPETT